MNINFDRPVVSGFQSHVTVNESETRNWFNEDGIDNPFGSNYINLYDAQSNQAGSRRNIGCVDNNTNNNNPFDNSMSNGYPGSNFGYIEPIINSGCSVNTTSSFYVDTPISNFITPPINFGVDNTTSSFNAVPASSVLPQQNCVNTNNNNCGGLNSTIESRRNITAINNSGNNPWLKSNNTVTTDTIQSNPADKYFSNPYSDTVTNPYNLGKMNPIDDCKKGIVGRWDDNSLTKRIPVEQPIIDWNNETTKNSISALNDESINKNSTWAEIADKNFNK